MNCSSCTTRMITSKHEEVEAEDGIVLCVQNVFVNECPACSALVKVVVPVYPPDQRQRRIA